MGVRGSQRIGMGFVLLVGLALGCGDGRMSIGDFCSRTGGPLCDRVIACGLYDAADRSTCLSQFQLGCCEGEMRCGEKFESDQEEMDAEAFIDSCVAALPTAECSALAVGDVPVACGGTAAARLPLSR